MADSATARMEILLEDLHGNVKIIAEGHQYLNDRIDGIQSDLVVIKSDLAFLRADVSVLKNSVAVLDGKFDRLDRRVGHLENRRSPRPSRDPNDGPKHSSRRRPLAKPPR